MAEERRRTGAGAGRESPAWVGGTEPHYHRDPQPLCMLQPLTPEPSLQRPPPVSGSGPRLLSPHRCFWREKNQERGFNAGPVYCPVQSVNQETPEAPLTKSSGQQLRISGPRSLIPKPLTHSDSQESCLHLPSQGRGPASQLSLSQGPRRPGYQLHSLVCHAETPAKSCKGREGATGSWRVSEGGVWNDLEGSWDFRLVSEAQVSLRTLIKGEGRG